MTKLMKKLNKFLEGVRKSAPAEVSTLKVESQDERFRGLFTPEAFERLQTRFKTVIYPRPERKTIFLSATAKSEDGIQRAALAIAEEVNHIEKSGNLLGCLAPLSTIKLADTWADEDGKYCGFRDHKGEDHFHFNGIVKEITNALDEERDPRFIGEKPEGAVFVPAPTAVFCFITVPYEYYPHIYKGNNMDLHQQEGVVGSVVFE